MERTPRNVVFARGDRERRQRTCAGGGGVDQYEDGGRVSDFYGHPT
jgi:hypothetical protein